MDNHNCVRSENAIRRVDDKHYSKEHLTHITTRAEKELAKLPPTTRRNVYEALAGTTAGIRTKQLSNIGLKHVYRIQVSGDGAPRIVYRKVSSRLVVVFVGPHHKYDDFITHWDGRVSGQLIPLTSLEEIMSHSQKNGSTKSPAQWSKSQTESPVASAAELLWQGIQEAMVQTIDTELSANLETVAELGRERTNTQFKTLSSKVVELDSRIKKTAEDTKTAQVRIADSVTKLEESLRVEMDRRLEESKATHRGMRSLRSSIDSGLSRVERGHSQWLQQLDEQQAKIKVAVTQSNDLLQAATDTLSAIQRSQVCNNEVVEQRFAALSESLLSAVKRLNVIQSSMDRFFSQKSRSPHSRLHALLKKTLTYARRTWQSYRPNCLAK